MRKMIYSISIFLFLFVLSTAFYNSYQVSLLKAQVREMEQLEVAEEESFEEDMTDTVHVDTPTVEQGYYLMEQDGCVYVYLGDKVTLYEKTSISLGSLPQSLQEEICQGKHLASELELYSFLENYSS